MAGQTEILVQLMARTLEGPVFGPGVAFEGEMDTVRQQAILGVTATIINDASRHLAAGISPAVPDKDTAFTRQTVAQIAPKTGAFVAGLTAGELTDDNSVHRLSLACQGVGYMYATDQLIDRGDKPMGWAVEGFDGRTLSLTPRERVLATARVGVLASMQTALLELGGEADGEELMDCFFSRVIRNEIRLQRLSNHYNTLLDRPSREPGIAFLNRHGATIAGMMVEDAGYQSVTSSLHVAYQAKDLSLPTVTEIHANPHIQKMLQVCNAVARVADERSDWYMDAGYESAFGTFSINPFNQPHTALTTRLCNLAGIKSARDIASMQKRFVAFERAEDNEERSIQGDIITSRFFSQLRTHVERAEKKVPAAYHTYMKLVKRVGEISFVNMEFGDIEMAGGTQA
jgi:hypothetical protein